MSESIPVRSFPSYEEAHKASAQLEAENISGKIIKESSGLFFSLLVAKEYSEKAAGLLEDSGFEPPAEKLRAKPVPTDTPHGFPFSRVSATAVRQAMEKKKRGLISKILTLVISLLIFAGAGLLTGSPLNLLMLVLVLLIHETGHWIGMKIFRYNDVQMFFIPGFGAAVSGEAATPSAKHQAIVSLLGPVPGILIGIACIIGYVFSKQQILLRTADMFLLINSFNLLPIYPLDGGRFLEAVLFSRHPKAEIGFKLVTALAIGFIAFQWKSAALGVLAYISIVSLKQVKDVAEVSKQLRAEVPPDRIETHREIPDHWLNRILYELDKKLPENQKSPRGFASAAQTIWNRIHLRHCSARATAGLTLIYLLFLAPYTGILALNKIAASMQQEKNSAPMGQQATDNL
ncbi:site-2 protease family protein [Tichowtungia aerotolerans]|uniref:Site-2 protease family protein n=1 Tax=Tichowtungia aerotolerans TaxID=2697043 RepID=A0A6P1MBM4_9BACT|nr:site-2 protease family protein [Tichowtungia aerotolerans]QHI68505.1 hypothetical protein GT409_03220 [Tichowtungia aerotolerans]